MHLNKTLYQKTLNILNQNPQLKKFAYNHEFIKNLLSYNIFKKYYLQLTQFQSYAIHTAVENYLEANNL